MPAVHTYLVTEVRRVSVTAATHAEAAAKATERFAAGAETPPFEGRVETVEFRTELVR